MRGVPAHHLYVHIPFCRLVCAYCDFVTVGGRREEIPRYVEALLAELDLRPAPGRLRTIYFGGGTPSLLPASAVRRVIDRARQRWTDADIGEITLEANPSAREAPDWSSLRAAGVTRVSLGVQSLRDEELHALARGHTAAEAVAALRGAQAAGFNSVSLDLIYGIPSQTLEDWREGLRRAIELAPDHVSLYALQVALDPDEWAAPPRPGALRWRRRIADGQDDALAADQYAMAEEALGAAGYRHYELSSWARPGHESRHNQAYWDRAAYTGIGAGAHSFDGAAERSWNDRDLDGYLAAIEAGRRPVAGVDGLDHADRAFEAIALGLRRVDGLDRASFAGEFGQDPVAAHAAAIARAVDAGLIEITETSLRLTSAGRLLASEVLVDFVPSTTSNVDTTSVPAVPFAAY